MRKPSLAIKQAQVTMHPGAKPQPMSAVIEVETGDPLGFYRFTEARGWDWYTFDNVYDYSVQ